MDELQQIFELQCTKYQYKLTDEADAAVREEIIRLESEKGENFANAREVRNLFEKIITNQAARVSELEDPDEETLSTITIEDLTDAFEEEFEKELAAREAREREIIEALEDIKEANAEAAAKEAKKGKKIKLPEKSPVIRR